MKAWIVTDEYDEYSTVVFAETRNIARLEALATDCCEGMAYLNIHPRRFEEADSMYRGRREMEWDDPEDRKFLVGYGWSCVEIDYSECPKCPASDLCDKYKGIMREKSEDDDEEDKK